MLSTSKTNEHAQDENPGLDLPRDHLLAGQRIIEDEHGARIAEVPARLWSDTTIAQLRAAQCDLVKVTESHFDELCALQGGLVLRPESVIWHMPISSYEKYLEALDARQRKRINNKLACSASQIIEIRELSEQDFKQWYEIYAAQEQRIQNWRFTLTPQRFAQQCRDHEVKAIMFYDSKNRSLLGGVILTIRPDRVTMSWAAYRNDARELELSTRAFVEALKFSAKHEITTLSSGMDRNLYGYYYGLGLMTFKASFGFVPKAAGNIHGFGFVSDKFFHNNDPHYGRDLLYFCMQSDGTLKARHLTDRTAAITTPKGIDVERVPFSML